MILLQHPQTPVDLILEPFYFTYQPHFEVFHTLQIE